LRAYLNEHSLQKESFTLDTLLKERIDLLKNNNKKVTFELHVAPKKLYGNKDAFTRILDNLLSNSLKYNKDGGFVKVTLKDGLLYIEDSGVGIQNPSRVFERFYKEQERGIGIGLHIVKKLCDEMGIKISLTTTPQVQSCFILDIKTLYAH
jgi:signal transduction histidine kinase